MKTLKFSLIQIFNLLLIGITILLINGCSNNLSREEACKIIVKKYDLPQKKIVEIRKKYYKSQEGDKGIFGMPYIAVMNHDYDYSNFKNMLVALESKGLITISETTTYSEHIHFTWATVNLTDEGRKYFSGENDEVYKLKSADIEMGEITGIIERDKSNSSEVNYTLNIKNITPFGEAFNINAETINKRTTFSKYDDGWRMDN